MEDDETEVSSFEQWDVFARVFISRGGKSSHIRSLSKSAAANWNEYSGKSGSTTSLKLLLNKIY